LEDRLRWDLVGAAVFFRIEPLICIATIEDTLPPPSLESFLN
jgi:hypothetical protein